MPLTKAKGNMYPWVTHTHTHLGGECPHKCSYCYVQAIQRRFGHARYKGELRLIEDELKVNYGAGRTIFVEHCNDLWADGVAEEWIEAILNHCCAYPENTYVFQTKNPTRYWGWLPLLPAKRLLGCTIETLDRRVARGLSAAPDPSTRCNEMYFLSKGGERTFITVEPILRGAGIELAGWLGDIEPEFVNIGADSKGTGLEEPSAEQVRLLLKMLADRGVEVRQKSNLERLVGG